jgi:hypothetical protein
MAPSFTAAAGAAMLVWVDAAIAFVSMPGCMATIKLQQVCVLLSELYAAKDASVLSGLLHFPDHCLLVAVCSRCTNVVPSSVHVLQMSGSSVALLLITVGLSWSSIYNEHSHSLLTVGLSCSRFYMHSVPHCNGLPSGLVYSCASWEFRLPARLMEPMALLC